MLCPSCGKEYSHLMGDCPSCRPAAIPTPGVEQTLLFAETLKSQQKRRAIPIAVIAVAIVMVASSHLFIRSIDFDGQLEPRIHRLMREAAGVQPVQNSIFPSERRFDNIVRQQYSNLIRGNREYLQAVKNADRSAIKQLTMPSSFVDSASAREGLKQLHALYDLDMAHDHELRELIGSIRRTLEADISSPKQRDVFDNGFDKGIVQSMAKYQRAIAAEQAWIQAVDDAYGYAERNHPAFLMNSGRQLVITNNRLRTEFNSRIQTMNARRNEFMQAKAEVDQWRAEQMKKTGLTAQEIGLL